MLTGSTERGHEGPLARSCLLHVVSRFDQHLGPRSMPRAMQARCFHDPGLHAVPDLGPGTYARFRERASLTGFPPDD